jgi:hypothetical protein
VASLGYHGRTAGTMGMTTSGSIYRSGFFPQSTGVFVTPFPYIINGPYGPNYSTHDMSSKASISESMYWGSSSRELAALDTVRYYSSVCLFLSVVIRVVCGQVLGLPRASPPHTDLSRRNRSHSDGAHSRRGWLCTSSPGIPARSKEDL